MTAAADAAEDDDKVRDDDDDMASDRMSSRSDTEVAVVADDVDVAGTCPCPKSVHNLYPSLCIQVYWS